MKRFIVIVLDGFGIGYMADTYQVRPQDVGANTCLHILEQMPELYLPNLERLGLMNALGCERGRMKVNPQATYGRANLAHSGADTFYGHQEIMGTNPQKPLVMPFSFCIDAVHQALVAADYRVTRYGEKVKFLLVNECVTVADNIEADLGQVFNITGALDCISFEEVLTIGRLVRQNVPVARVIALGGKGITGDDLLWASEEKEGAYIGINCPKSGVYNEGYQVIHLGYGVDPTVQIPTILGQAGIDVILFGKVADIVSNAFGKSISCVDTEEVMQLTVNCLADTSIAFISTNVQETDLAGHAGSVVAYGGKLEIADRYLGIIMNQLSGEDLLVVMADHGNDPTIGHSHHTREQVPLLLYGKKIRPGFIGNRTTLSDVGATVADYFGCSMPQNGQSFLNLLQNSQ